MKNALLKWLVRLVRPFIRKGEPGRFLIVSTTALGDTLWATPAIESLRKSFPDGHIAVLTSETGLQVLEENPHIDQFFSIQKPWALFKERFHTIFILHTSQRIVLPLCSLLGASRIIGTQGLQKGLDSLLTDALPNSRRHEIERRLDIIRTAGASVHTEKLSFFAPKSLPQKPGLTIALHPGSKDRFKRWPFFAELGKKLQETMPCQILITGTEKDLLEELATKIPNAKIAPQGSLKDLAALLQQIDLLIANDTGPVHLACALNRPVVAIYASTDPALCGPQQAANTAIIARKSPCTPCLKRKCRLPFCFLQISPEEVAAAAYKLLA